MSPLIALLSDFGTREAYVGVMKGVILALAPEARLVDLTHEIAPQAVSEAAYTLVSAVDYFPSQTIFCCVVDPGVGSERRALAVQLALTRSSAVVVCPDNGLLTPLLARVRQAVVLDNPRYHLVPVSATFHGRDIFAPAAAHLARGVPLGELGSPLSPEALVRLEWPEPQVQDDGFRAHVIHVDRFGNLITNLPGDWLSPPWERWEVRLAAQRIRGIRRTYAEVAPGEALAYVGSGGYLELAVRQGSARDAWGADVGTDLEVVKLEP
jgi:S-adenosylmethionine hydrolase